MNENEYSFKLPPDFAPQTPDADKAAPRQPEVTREAEAPCPAAQYQAAPQTHSPFFYAPQQRSSASPAYAQTRAVPQEKPKKKRMTLRVAVVALCCAILGSLLGGGAVGLIMHNMYQKDNETAAVTDVLNPQKPTESLRQPTETVTQPTESAPAKQVSNTDLKTPAQIYAQNVDAVVGISNEGTTTNVFGQVSETASSGSGFVISSDGEILTNYHVVEGAKKLTVTLYDGRVFTATVVGYEAESDVALLKIDATGLQTVTLGNSDTLQEGDQVSAIGNPLGELTYSITVGFLSAKDRSVNTDGTPINMMQIDAAINPGNSGGPLFDQYGNVIGITTAKYSGTTGIMGTGATIEGIGFAIPINDVLAILDELRETGTVSNRAYIGIYGGDVTADQKENGLPNGVYVSSVVQGSSGEKAGLKEGDVITAVGSTAIKDFNGLSHALKAYRGGDSAVLTVWRGGRSVELQIVFDSKSNQPDAQPEPTEPTQEPETETEPFDPWEYFPWDLLP